MLRAGWKSGAGGEVRLSHDQRLDAATTMAAAFTSPSMDPADLQAPVAGLYQAPVAGLTKKEEEGEGREEKKGEKRVRGRRKKGDLISDPLLEETLHQQHLTFTPDTNTEEFKVRNIDVMILFTI